MPNLLHKKCKLGVYVRGQMPKNANVICEGSLSLTSLIALKFIRYLKKRFDHVLIRSTSILFLERKRKYSKSSNRGGIHLVVSTNMFAVTSDLWEDKCNHIFLI